MPDRPRAPSREAELRAVTIGSVEPLNGHVELCEYDLEWPSVFAREAARIAAAVGPRALEVEHVGSTSVPGLAAKPRIDIVLLVASSADEDAYVPSLVSVGYTLRIREPAWFEHRLLRRPEPDVNLHVFSAGCPEVESMVAFRDWLRSHDDDRELYLRTKRTLAVRTWTHVQDYADAKGPVISEILGRARADGAASGAPR